MQAAALPLGQPRSALVRRTCGAVHSSKQEPCCHRCARGPAPSGCHALEGMLAHAWKCDYGRQFEDSNHVLWSHDRHGRWFANINGQKVWLGRKLAGLRHGLRHGRGHVASNLKASHNCGHCDCVRWQHNRFQSRSEDVLDREYHQRHGNVLRPELRALFACDPQLLTPNQPAQIAISRDLSQSPMTSVELERSRVTSCELV